MNIRTSTTPKQLHAQRGVTLIELLITTGLLSVLLVTLSMIFTASVDMQTQTGSYSAVTADSRFALSRLDHDIRRASAVTTPANPGDSSATLVLSIDGSTYTYSVDNDRLQLDIDGTSDYLTGGATTTSNLSFQKLGDNSTSIRYEFSITNEAGRHPDTQHYTSTTGLRP